MQVMDSDILIADFPLIGIDSMASTGAALTNYPLVDQLHEPTSDGLADENARMNCVFASYAGVVKFLCRPNHQDVNGDYIKDHDPYYGPDYLGGSSGEHIAPTVKQLYDVDTAIQYNAAAMLLGLMIRGIDLGDPTIFTIPSAWNSQPSVTGYNQASPNFPTHAVTFIGYNPTTREALAANPWGGFIHRGSYDYWTQRICYNKAYATSYAGAQKMPLPTGWTKDANGILHNPQTTYPVQGALAEHILAALSWDAGNVPVQNQQHLTDPNVPFEYSNPAFGKGNVERFQQIFRKTMLAATQRTSGATWTVTEEYIGVELLWLRNSYLAQVTQIASLKAQLAQTHSGPIVAVSSALDKATADLAAVIADLGAAKAANK